MSVQPVSKRALKAAVAATAAGALVLTPLTPALPALAQEAGETALEPVAIRVGRNREFTRVEFAGVVGSRARVRREGADLIVRVGTTAAPDVSRLRVEPTDALEDVQTRAVSGGTEIVLTLKPGADARDGVADGAVWLNLFAPGQAPAAPAAAPDAPVPVRADATESRLNLTFAFAAPTPAAVFRRGPAIWMVFEGKARLELARGQALGPARDLRWAAGPDYTVVRLEAPETLQVSATAEGSTWVVNLGQGQTAAGGVGVTRDDTGPATLVAQLPGATRAIWLTDPLVGDRFAAVPAQGPAKGLDAPRRTRELALPATAQGLLVEARADGLEVDAQGDLVRISRAAGGLKLSPPSMALDAAAPDGGAPARAAHPALVLERWADVGHGGFLARHRELQNAAAAETAAAVDNPRAPIEARMAYARFLVASGLSFEAIGVLNALATAPGMSGEPELRGLRGAARAAIGRLEDAAVDFAAGSLAGDPSAAAWRGYIAANQADWDTARREFASGASVIDDFAPEWRARFASAHALAAIETGDLPAARDLLAYAFAQDVPAADQLAARLIQARYFELTGDGARALAVYKAVGRAPLDGVATPAKMAAVRMELAKGQIDAVAAAERLEALKWRWRGDATELQLIRTLGGIYLSQGRYREALTTLRSAGGRLPDLPEAAALQQDLANAFRALFLEGAADGLQPVQALALFYDFRDLTPVGAEGDDMVRRLARRLVDVDLLGPAAELLQYQVDERLDGVAKAQVATDLATIYLMNREAEKALQAIWASRTTILPTALNAERRAVEARALMELGRYDHALEVLGDGRDPAASDVRAEILWKQQKYGDAAAMYERRLGDRFREAGPLDAADENRVIRAGVGYSLAGQTDALRRLSANYDGFIQGARNAAALRIALSLGGDVSPGDFAAIAARADTFAGWVAEMKAALRAKTGAGAQTQAGAGAPAPAPANQPARAAA